MLARGKRTTDIVPRKSGVFQVGFQARFSHEGYIYAQD